MTQYVKTSFQLKDHHGQAINGTGGVVHVATHDYAAKASIYDKDGVALSNPRSLTAGGVEFHVASTVTQVDLYIQAPDGQFLVRRGVAVGAYYDFVVNTDVKLQLFEIPFAAADSTAATEKDTGFNLPAHAAVLGKYSGASIRVITADATETIDVGTLSTESGGDADGLMAAVSVNAAAQVGTTEGALHSTSLPYLTDAQTAKSISYTLTAGSDTADGIALIPVVME